MTTTVLEPIAVPAPIAAPDEIEVVVALRHIAAGKRGSSFKCALALALIEDGYLDGLEVEHDRMRFWTDTEHRYDLPPEAREWIRRFDDHEPVAPERFRLTRQSGAA